MARNLLNAPKYRSRYEQQTAAWFKDNAIKFKYEAAKLKYFQPIRKAICVKCHSKTVSKLRVYLADFAFPGRTFFVETKGRFTSADRTKMLAILNMGYDVRLVFQRNNRINKTSAVTYGRWAELHGIRYSIGVPDIKWFSEVKRGKRKV